MDDREPSYLYGALSLLEDCREAVETLFTRYEQAEDAGTKRRIVEAALHELKVHATIEELMLHPELEPELLESERARRRHVEKLIAELEPMTGDESRHDARFALLSANVRRHFLELDSALCPSAHAHDDGRKPRGRRLYAPPARAAFRSAAPAL